MLDILICSLVSRQKKLDRLMSILHPQVNSADVEVTIEQDDGEMSIGQKRNRLMYNCSHPYLCFVDDDDIVDEMYVPLILDAIAKGHDHIGGPIDCVGMCGYIIEKGQRTWQFRHSVTVDNWCKDRQNKIYFRTPNHLNPIRTEIAHQCSFPNVSHGEDKAYSDQLKGMCRTEEFIETPIYFYMMGEE